MLSSSSSCSSCSNSIQSSSDPHDSRAFSWPTSSQTEVKLVARLAMISALLWLLFLCLLQACTPTADALLYEATQTQSQDEEEALMTPIGTSLMPTWGMTWAMVDSHYAHTATLLPNGKVLVVGGYGRDFASTEVYDTATGIWSSTSSPFQNRYRHTATLLPNGKVLVVGGMDQRDIFTTPAIASAELYDPATGTWSSTGSLTEARCDHTATLLANGKVIVAGGNNILGPLSSAEIYDPATGTWTLTGSLTEARYGHTATLLPNSKVLVVGRSHSAHIFTSAEVYDPATGIWSSTGSLQEPRYEHTATLLPNGKVLVTGGVSITHGTDVNVASAEVYDSVTGTWSPTGSMSQVRVLHAATLLPNGKVLVVGGTKWGDPVASAEVYDPAIGAWSPIASLTDARFSHTATLLPNGRILVVAGAQRSALDSAEIYDTTPMTWSSSASLSQDRYGHTATLLPNGKVLVVGGADSGSVLTSVEVYNPALGAWYPTGSLSQGRYGQTATLLPNGRVLVTGGNGISDPLVSAEVYDPATGAWSNTGSLNNARSEHTATLLPNGKVLVVGGMYGQSPLASSEVYDPATGAWSSTGPLNKARSEHTATLLPNGKVLVVGGNGTLGPLSSAEVYDPATGAWTPTGSLMENRYGHTATLLPDGKILVAGGWHGARSLATAEMYEPSSGIWYFTGSLVQARFGHRATLLPNGKVLVIGGALNFVNPLASCELFDPTRGNWSSTSGLSMWRSGHTMTLLPDGSVLAVGGGATAATEVYVSIESAVSAAWLPHITTVSPTRLEPGTSLSLAGTQFQGIAEASGGNMQSSSTNYPLLSLRDIERERWLPLSGRDFSSTSVTTTLPYVHSGHYLLNITTNALTSSKIISISNTLPPETLIFSHTPTAQLTKETGANFWFTCGDVDLASFECSLDGSPFTTCSSPKEYLSLRDGERFFRVRARDLADNPDPTPAEYHWTIDTTPPETSIDEASRPPATTSTSSARFSFISTAKDIASFECSLDSVAFSPCISPKDYTALSEGAHTFRVRAADILGNLNPVAATYSWTIDPTIPETTITAAPPSHSPVNTATFAFNANRASSSFECSLDEAAFSACLSLITFDSLKEGSHLFRVRARRAPDSVDPSPANYAWTIDLTAPDTSILSKPDAETRVSAPFFTFSSTEPDSSFTCMLDMKPVERCENIPSLNDGMHELEVRAKDEAGNLDESPATYTWRVDTTPPALLVIQQPAPHQTLTAPTPVFSGVTENGATVTVLVDDIEVGTYRADNHGAWKIHANAPLPWGQHRLSAYATDTVGNVSERLPEVSFSTSKLSHYNMDCSAASPTRQAPWPWALLLLRLLRRRSRPVS